MSASVSFRGEDVQFVGMISGQEMWVNGPIDQFYPASFAELNL